MDADQKKLAEPAKVSFPWTRQEVHEYTEKHTRHVEVKGHYFTRFGVWLLASFAQALSMNGAWKFGTFLGRLMRLLGIRKDVVMTNLDIAYGDSKTPAQKAEIYKKCMDNVSRMAMNYLRISTFEEKFWDESFTFRNEEILKNAYNKGKGVIILSMHYGAWELPGGKIGMSGYPISNIIKTIKNPVTDRFLIDMRTQMNLCTIPHKKSMKRIMDGFARGEGIIFAIDQNMKRSQGLFVDWMGRTASTIRSVAYIAKETGASVVPGYSYQHGPSEFEVVVLDEISFVPFPDDPEEEMRINTRNFIAPFENVILAEPEGWLWLHRRWKVQPDEKDNPYK